MQNKLKNKIEKELKRFLGQLEKRHPLSKISPLLFKSIKKFVLRKGKRIRPVLFTIGYLGLTKKPAANFYQSALSFELLHDFFLVHDDIVDKSILRRGKPSMHTMLNNYLKKFKQIKFNGQDLAIVSGDVIYAIALDAFLSIRENAQRKIKALKIFIAAAAYTGMGEFIELLSGTKNIDKITKQDIYRIYDYKTAYYTFAAPLSCAATLAGAGQTQSNRLRKYGI
ncbi:MAG: polyprenyl synthetase family protein, partial [Omnitrophica bacterium]|nr:polyprenyl synthetase family protein [Candidatus Omnitrophota bacterium]